MKKFWISTAIVAALGASLVFAQAAQHGERGDHGFMGGRMAKALNLTDAQQAQIKSIMQAEKPKMQPLMEQLRGDEQQIRDASKATPFDEAKVTSLAASEAQVRAQMTVERARMQSQIYQLLTPEQRTKADAMQERIINRFHKHSTPDSQAGSAQPQQQ